MTDVQIDEKMRQIIRDTIPRKCVQRDCQYLGNASERFCRMTTNRNCYSCKFYEPNIHGKIRRIIEYVIRMETEHESDLKIWKRRYQEKTLECISAQSKLEKYRSLESTGTLLDNLENM